MTTSTHNVAVLVGSLRKASLNRKVARALALVAPSRLSFGVIDFETLPLYDEDLEAEGAPVPWKSFREQVRRHDAVLFITPEYNRSVPGGLKNAIDVGSRPYGKSVWSGKPAAVISASPGKVGGFGANHHLRQSLVFLDMPVLQQPEMYLGGANTLFDGDGSLIDDDARSLLIKFASAFAAWIDRTARPT
jgi:chromate reductase